MTAARLRYLLSRFASRCISTRFGEPRTLENRPECGKTSETPAASPLPRDTIVCEVLSMLDVGRPKSRQTRSSSSPAKDAGRAEVPLTSMISRRGLGEQSLERRYGLSAWNPQVDDPGVDAGSRVCDRSNLGQIVLVRSAYRGACGVVSSMNRFSDIAVTRRVQRSAAVFRNPS